MQGDVEGGRVVRLENGLRHSTMARHPSCLPPAHVIDLSLSPAWPVVASWRPWPSFPPVVGPMDPTVQLDPALRGDYVASDPITGFSTNIRGSLDDQTTFGNIARVHRWPDLRSLRRLLSLPNEPATIEGLHGACAVP